ncbi:metalloprotease family protein [Staphylococcus hyicus]|uniref:metalloprotease family protein n=1 Tax=Staphylococcus hyicus TaxID=1284 RepID=UPI00208EF884|nr:DUF3267 domain-containing protein [Staphylococcus hyicus]MCO4329558.1 DUF3267 domain-containing protein [Staphylococcus hyicus]MCO4332091.1 DUF3267 domain-containing protein [Staphylococcus hyicus]MCO4333636.1 DUF3267 domain-containing protein [Staphylococcus hyicus]MCO4336529.1 DUF3267 domain-containing protein [Staphylococcus hyicus]UWF57612.1 DUF3267 domain-containing protein [Staphylococcus hyicus]
MYTINIFEDSKIRKRLLLTQCIVALVFIVLSYKWSMALTGLEEKNIFANLTVGFVGLVMVVIIQELIRYVLLRLLYTKATPKYKFDYCYVLSYLPEVKMNRKTFSTVMLLPSMLMSMMLLLIFINVPNTYIIFIFSFYMGYTFLSVYLVMLVFSNKQAQSVELTEEGLSICCDESSHMN